MLSKEKLREMHVKSFEKLKEGLPIKNPHWLGFGKNPIEHSELYELYDSDKGIIMEPLRPEERIGSYSLITRYNDSNNALMAGTWVPPNVMDTYSDLGLTLGIFHENYHNIFCEIHTLYHVLAGYIRYYSDDEKERNMGDSLSSFEECSASFFSKIMALELGINEKDVYKTRISRSRDFRDMEYVKALKILKGTDRIIEMIGLDKIMKDPWTALSQIPGMCNSVPKFQQYFKGYENILKRIYKKEMSGRWVRIK